MKRIIIVIIYILISNSIFSQQIKVTNDLGAWYGVNIEKELSENFSLNLEQQIRFNSNAIHFDDYLVEFGAAYKMNKNFKLRANLRYIYNTKLWSEKENNFRYNLDLIYKALLSDKFTFYYRIRYQHRYVNLFSDYQSTNIQNSAFRNRIKLKYRINETHKAYFSAEIFRLTEIYHHAYFNKIRFYLGDEINSKIGCFNISLGYEKEINDLYPLSFFFLKTIYTIEL